MVGKAAEPKGEHSPGHPAPGVLWLHAPQVVPCR
jgi:hypothetical protein